MVSIYIVPVIVYLIIRVPVASSNKKNREICAICEKKLKKNELFHTCHHRFCFLYDFIYLFVSVLSGVLEYCNFSTPIPLSECLNSLTLPPKQ